MGGSTEVNRGKASETRWWLDKQPHHTLGGKPSTYGSGLGANPTRHTGSSRPRNGNVEASSSKAVSSETILQAHSLRMEWGVWLLLLLLLLLLSESAECRCVQMIVVELIISAVCSCERPDAHRTRGEANANTLESSQTGVSRGEQSASASVEERRSSSSESLPFPLMVWTWSKSD